MKIHLDITHAGDVHLFKHFIWKMQEKGHTFSFTSRTKEFATYLLSHYGFEHYDQGENYRNPILKILGLFKFDWQVFKYSKKFKPDIFLSMGSIYAAHASSLLGRPHICLDDTWNPEQLYLYTLFTNAVLTPESFPKTYNRHQIRYKGFHELAYLHPNHFKPNDDIFNFLGVEKGEKYTIMRFSAFDASHDYGHKGVKHEFKLKAIEEFSKFGKVFITSQKKLTSDLEPYRIPIPPERIHDALYYSALLFGESPTMATEAAVLGIPAIYIDKTGRFYTRELEDNFGLVYNFKEDNEQQQAAIEKGIELLSNLKTNEVFKEKQLKLLNKKIDVTAFLIWFVENYPKSREIMKREPEFQDGFR
jgi:predicted glycosyltransferase